MWWIKALQVVLRLPVPLRKIVIVALSARLRDDLTLHPSDLMGRRVLILGPARTVAEDLAELDAARFDIVIRMNNGLDTPVPALGPEPLRCDMLFHSLMSDARPVTTDALRRAGVGVLVHRTATRGAFLHTVIARRRFGAAVRVCCLPLARYQALSTDLGGHSPTTGLVAADLCLSAPLAELAVVGFSFFQTSYCAGYDPAVGDDAAARRRIANAAHHDPAAEARLFARLVRSARERGMTVTLGPQVEVALEQARQVR